MCHFGEENITEKKYKLNKINKNMKKGKFKKNYRKFIKSLKK